MRKLIVLMFIAAMVAIPLLAQAQEAASHHPPKMLQIYREDVKPGKGAAHEKVEAGWPVAFQKAKLPYYSLGTTALSGANQAWFFIPYESFTDMEKADKLMRSNSALMAEMDRLSAADGEMISDMRGMIAMYQPEVSYRPNFNIGEMKYFTVLTVRVKPGYGEEFRELRKLVNAAHEKNNMDEHMLVYQVTDGAPAVTFLVFQPFKQISDMDMGDKIHNDAYRAALGPEFQKRNIEFAKNAVMMSESNILAINPKMSYVSEETASADMNFWRPKPAMAKAKKGAETVAKDQKPKQ